MNDLIQALCCCFFPLEISNQQTEGNNFIKKSKRGNKEPKPSRIKTQYRRQEVIQIYKDEKKSGISAYTCPICTLYFNKILACDNCENLMCFKCAKTYEKRYEKSSSQNMKCPFCNSQKSMFVDYEKEEKKYFDDSTIKKEKNQLEQKHDGYKNQHSTQAKNLPTGGQYTNLKQIHINRPVERRSLRSFEDQSSQVQILPIGLESSGNGNDLEFIDQFELRTVENRSVE